MTELLRYAGVVRPKPNDVARLVELWTKAQEPGLTADARQAAFRDLFIAYARLHGMDVSDRPQALAGLGRFAATTFEAGGRMDLRLPEPRGAIAGNYLHVDKQGSGPLPLLLISDLGVDGRKLYESFARRTASTYTMHIVTLPWAGAARRLPWPEKQDYAGRPWLTEIERELLAIVDGPQLAGVSVVGTSGGGYFAARLALLRPKRVRAVAVVDSLVAAPLRSNAAQDAPAPMPERLMRMKAVTPTPQIFPTVPMPPPNELRRLIDDPKSTHPTIRNWMAFAVKDDSISRPWTFEALSTGFFIPSLEYRWEMTTTDLTEDMKNLSVPILAMGAIHDEGSPGQSPPSLSQWEELKLLYPSIPLTVVSFEDSRSYISVECPAEFDAALAAFVAKRPVHGKQGFTIPRTSARASVMQSVGAGEIRISYGRPAVKERKIWGALVPYNRVWRAGANEATTFAFSRDVQVGDRTLAAGTYTFFVVPTEKDWTVIFNRVPRQWGAFNYNPAFDAVRFSVASVEAPHEEQLSYRIDADGTTGASVTLSWEKKRVSFPVLFVP